MPRLDIQEAVAENKRRLAGLPPEQVINASLAGARDLTPVSQAPAEAVRAAWLPVSPGQTVPLIWEPYPEEPLT